MYRLWLGSGDIDEKEVVSATAKTVTFACARTWAGKETQRENRDSDYIKWFESRKEAEGWRLGAARAKVELLRNQLAKAEGELAALDAKEPAP